VQDCQNTTKHQNSKRLDKLLFAQCEVYCRRRKTGEYLHVSKPKKATTTPSLCALGQRQRSAKESLNRTTGTVIVDSVFRYNTPPPPPLSIIPILVSNVETKPSSSECSQCMSASMVREQQQQQQQQQRRPTIHPSLFHLRLLTLFFSTKDP
jgi:hypothetical protein